MTPKTKTKRPLRELKFSARDGDTVAFEHAPYDSKEPVYVWAESPLSLCPILVCLKTKDAKKLRDWLLKALPLSLALLFLGCASVPFDARDKSDTVCTKPGAPLTVVLRHGVSTWPALISCEDAVKAVSFYAEKQGVKGAWTVFFTGGWAGFDVDEEMKPYNPLGVTYPATRSIVVAAGSPRVLEHEMGHASDFDHGRKNTRDR